jgi:hypothetical protein
MQSTPDLIHIGSLKSWTAPECTSINRVPMRATAYPFPTAQSARSVDREKTPWFQSLNGQWQFKAADRPENVVLTVLVQSLLSGCFCRANDFQASSRQDHGPHFRSGACFSG